MYDVENLERIVKNNKDFIAGQIASMKKRHEESNFYFGKKPQKRWRKKTTKLLA